MNPGNIAPLDAAVKAWIAKNWLTPVKPKAKMRGRKGRQ